VLEELDTAPEIGAFAGGAGVGEFLGEVWGEQAALLGVRLQENLARFLDGGGLERVKQRRPADAL
jgi:hypothetical protein